MEYIAHSEAAESTVHGGGARDAAELTAHSGGAGEATESTVEVLVRPHSPLHTMEVLARLLCLLNTLKNSQFFSSFQKLSAFFLCSFLRLSKSVTFLLLYHPDPDSSYSFLFLIQGCYD